MTVSSPISVQARGEPAAIVPAVIQRPKAMMPTEIKNENAAFMMISIPTSERTASAFRRQSKLGAGACISRVITVCPDAYQKSSTWCSLIVTAAGQASEAALEDG